MSQGRNYGNSSGFENTKRIRYGGIVQPLSTREQLVMPHDCISCPKHLTGVIPNNERCKLICGKYDTHSNIR